MRFRPRRAVVPLLLTWTLLCLAEESSAQPRPPRATLAAAREAAIAGRRDRVLVHGTVTRAGAGGVTFIQDESAGIAVLEATPPVALEPGQLVEIEGHSSRSTRGPAIAPTRITLTGRGPLPPAAPLDWHQLRAGALDGRLITAGGIARRSSPRGDGVLIRLMTDEGLLEVDVPAMPPSGGVEVDARVTVQGVLAPLAAVDGRTIGYEVLVPTPAQVHLDEPGTADPFSLPVVRIANLSTLPAGFAHRLRVEGVVTRHRPGQLLSIQDASGSLQVETDLDLPLEVGDRVDVAGFPMLDRFTPYLTDASYRRVSGGAPPPPVSAIAAELASGLHDAALVRTAGRLVDVERSKDDLTLVLQDRETVFHARIPGDRSGTLESELQPASELQLTGISSVIVDADRRPRAFRLLLRDASDVAVLREPPAPAETGPPAWAWLAVAAAMAAIGGAGVYYRRTMTQERTIHRQMAREAGLKARFDDLFERTADIMVVHDRRGQVATMNRTGEQVSGYPREEMRMLDPSWLFSERYNDTIQRMILEGVEAAPRTIRAELITRKSARVPIEAHARVLVGDGQITGVTVVARNVAEREQLEMQLRQAQKMEAVGRLATGIAHDFNNLITVLLGYSDELMEVVEAASPLRKPVEEVHRAVERASGLTQQLLAFSRRGATAPEQIDLNVAVSNMRDLLERLLGPEITLEVHLDPALARVQADPAQVGQIIMNLAVNARDAMPHGGTLAITTANVELGAEHLDVIPGAHVMLEVRDTGVGMTQDVQRRVFEPFFTTKDFGQGIGLGLSMVYAIVRQSAGHITVSSAPGKGSTFHVYFPRADAPRSDVPAATPKAAPAPAPARGSAVVLLAEDDRQVRQLMVSELRRRGFTVLEARHGAEALEICKQYGGDIDVLVTDVVMPTMNGVDLVSAASPLRPEMRVLFMSGHPERAGVGLDPGGPQGERLLVKPFLPQVLVNRINELLGSKPSEAPPQTAERKSGGSAPPR